VRRVLAARITKFPGLQPVLVLLAVLGSRVVAVFTIAALQGNNFAHRSTHLAGYPAQ
jgi:hypothetical protein